MREYRVWTKEEEHALRLGVAKHGSGAWELIRTDPDFNATLQARSGIQLKDKWRNLVKFNHLSEAERSLGPKSRLQQSRSSQRTPTTPIMAESEAIPERPTRHRSRKSTHATMAATTITTTQTYTPPPTPSPTQPPVQATPTSSPAVGKISREQALLDHVLQLTDGVAAGTSGMADQPNCDDTTHSTPSSASGERKFTAFLGTRSRSSFDAELAADAIAAQILTSVPAALVPTTFDSGEDATDSARKRSCTPLKPCSASKNDKNATCAAANEQGSATVSAEMPVEKNAGSSAKGHQAPLKGPLDAPHLEINGTTNNYCSPGSKQPLLAAAQHHSNLNTSVPTSTAGGVSPGLSVIHPLCYAAPTPAATNPVAHSNMAQQLAASDRSALQTLSAAAAAAAAGGSITPGGGEQPSPSASPADSTTPSVLHAAHACNTAASGPGFIETKTLGSLNSHMNVLPGNKKPKTEPCGSPSTTQKGSPNAAGDSIMTSQQFCTEFNNNNINNTDAHMSDRQQPQAAAAAAAAAAVAAAAAATATAQQSPQPADPGYPPTNGAINTSPQPTSQSPPSLDSKSKLPGASTHVHVPLAIGGSIKCEPQPQSSQPNPPCAGNITPPHSGLNRVALNPNGNGVGSFLHGGSSGGGAGGSAAGGAGDQEERSGRTGGDKATDKHSPSNGRIPPAIFNAAAAATVALSDENAHHDEAGGTARDGLCNGLGHPAAVSCAAVAAAADETCMEASCIETPVHAPIPAHVLEKVQGIMARHSYSVLRVLPGGQAQLFAELAKGKQFVYFSPFEVDQMIVVEKTQSDSD